MNIQDLYILLQSNGINTESYSIGKAKSVEQLHKEILLGETKIIMDGEKLIREIDALYLVIKRSIDSNILREKWQQHAGKQKNYRFCLLAEKMINGESDDIECIVTRAINEELGSLQIKLEFNIELNTLYKYKHEIISESYPELTTRYNIYLIQVKINNLPETDFETIEYEKENPLKIRLTTAWEWVEPSQENFKPQAIQKYLDKYQL